MQSKYNDKSGEASEGQKLDLHEATEGTPSKLQKLDLDKATEGTPSKQQAPAIQLSSPNGVSDSLPRGGSTSKLSSAPKAGNKKASQVGGNNLTSSLSNMMSQLDTSIRGSPGSSSQHSLVEDDAISFKVYII